MKVQQSSQIRQRGTCFGFGNEKVVGNVDEHHFHELMGEKIKLELDKTEKSRVDHSLKKTRSLELRGFPYSVCFLPKNVGNTKKQMLCRAPLVLICRALLPPAPPPPAPEVKGRGSANVLLSLSGRILDLKTGTVKKEGQQSSMRMCMGSRRSFICRMRSVWGAVGWAVVGWPLLTCH